jgi:hypothetical protein
MPTIFAIDGAEFADFGAVSQGVTELQTALKALGQGVGDNILRAIVVDGLIGPKTTAATNRAMTVHVGSGQAPANLRTGSLSQATVAAQASSLAQIIETEAQRRGYNVPTAKVIATVAKASAPKPTITPAPAAYVPTSAVSTAARAPQTLPAASDDSTATIIKYGAIGLGLVVVTAGIYYAMKRQSGNLRGFFDSDEGARYKTFIRSAKSIESFSRARKRTVDTGLTYDEAKRAAQRFNADRTSRQINAGTKMEFTQE